VPGVPAVVVLTLVKCQPTRVHSTSLRLNHRGPSDSLCPRALTGHSRKGCTEQFSQSVSDHEHLQATRWHGSPLGLLGVLALESAKHRLWCCSSIALLEMHNISSK